MSIRNALQNFMPTLLSVLELEKIYLELGQTSEVELFEKIINDFKPLSSKFNLEKILSEIQKLQRSAQRHI